MEKVNKVHIKVADVELSVQGDQDFINKYSDPIDMLLEKLDDINHDSSTILNKSEKVNSNGNPKSMEDFVLRFDNDKPSDNALLLAAYHFSRYGSDSFTYDEIRDMSDESGIILPDRIDMTFKKASRNGKSLFTSGGHGKMKPTIHGQQFFRDEYEVEKGTENKTDTNN